MRIGSTIFGGVTATLISIFGVGTNEKDIPPKGPPPLTRSFPERSAPVPHPFLLAQLPPAENKPLVKTQDPPPTYLISKELREKVQNNVDLFSAFSVTQSSAYLITEKDIDIALEKENSRFAAGVGKNTTTNPVLFKKLLQRALENPNTRLAFGVFQNRNKDLFTVTKELKEKYKEKAKKGNVEQYEAVIAMHPTWKFEDEERKLAVESSSTMFRYYAAQNPSFFDGLSEKEIEEFKDIARCGGNSEAWFSEGLPQNKEYRFNTKDLKVTRTAHMSWFTHGAARNKNYPWGAEDDAVILWNPHSHLKIGRTQTPYYFGQPSYTHPSLDSEISKDFYRTNLAYQINIDPNSPVSSESTDFGRKSNLASKSAYTIGQIRNPQFNPGDNDIQWILEDERNANTEFAYEIGLKLNFEQIRKDHDVTINKKPEKISIQEVVRSYLIDTAFAEAVGKNPNFAEIHPNIAISEIDKRFIQGDQQQGGRVSYAFTKLAAGLIQNLYYGEIEPADVSIAQREFIRSTDFAYHLAKKLNEKQIQSVKDLDDFLIKNPSSKFVLGLFNNEAYKPSEKISKFLLENSKSDFIRELAKSKAFKITPEIKKIVFQNPDDELAYGAAQNESWGIVSPEEKQWIFEQGNYNTLAAGGLLMNTECYKMGDAKIEKEFLKKDKENLNTMAAYLIGAHPEFILDYEFSQIAREKPTHLTRGVRNNPQANITALYIPERERR